MATTIVTHCRLGIVDPSGNVNILYPQTVGADVSINPTTVVSATTVQDLVDSLKASAFISDFTGIDDTSTTSTTATYSAKKIAELNSDLSNTLNDKQNKNLSSSIGGESTVEGALSAQNTAIGNKADSSHTHDDRYYTESEVNSLLSGKSDTTHNHSGIYSPVGHTHDDRYYTETEIKNILSNPNLLGNPWFSINQRGETIYYGNKYTVDRWKCNDGAGGNSSVTVNNNGTITITNLNTADSIWFCQYIEDYTIYNNKTVTWSFDVISSSGTVSVYTSHGYVGSLSNKSAGIYTFTNNNSNTPSYNYLVNIVVGHDSSITLKAAKLELGSISTLALDAKPDYTTELEKCRGYYQKFYYEAPLNPDPVASNPGRCEHTFTTSMKKMPTILNQYADYSFNGDWIAIASSGIQIGFIDISGSYTIYARIEANANNKGQNIRCGFEAFADYG